MTSVEEPGSGPVTRGPVVDLGPWGQVQGLAPTHDLPGRPGSRRLWLGTAHRLPVLLTLAFRAAVTTRGLPYVAVWPQDLPAPPADGPSSAADLEGAVLTQPVEHACARCGGLVVGLYPDVGVPFFRPGPGRYGWVTACPLCGAHVDDARLHTLLLPVPGAPPG